MLEVRLVAAEVEGAVAGAVVEEAARTQEALAAGGEWALVPGEVEGPQGVPIRGACGNYSCTADGNARAAQQSPCRAPGSIPG